MDLKKQLTSKEDFLPGLHTIQTTTDIQEHKLLSLSLSLSLSLTEASLFVNEPQSFWL
jgi:hypothetical protein